MLKKFQKNLFYIYINMFNFTVISIDMPRSICMCLRSSTVLSRPSFHLDWAVIWLRLEYLSLQTLGICKSCQLSTRNDFLDRPLWTVSMLRTVLWLCAWIRCVTTIYTYLCEYVCLSLCVFGYCYCCRGDSCPRYSWTSGRFGWLFEFGLSHGHDDWSFSLWSKLRMTGFSVFPR